MTQAGLPTATIIAAFSHSSCNACGGGCDPREKEHTTRLPGYSRKPTVKGCGIKFTHITTRSEHPSSKKRAQEMRPDLVFISFPR
jgi:hypothetical protein